MSKKPFRERPDRELQALSDEQIVDYIQEANAAGRPDAAKRGLAIFVFGEWERVRWRVERKVPKAEAEDVTASVIHNALATVFAGRTVGELRSLVNRITARRIADFHRGRKVVDPLPEPEADDGGRWGPGPESGSDAGWVETRLVVDSVLDGLSEEHRRVVELYLFEQWSAAEIAAELEGMSEDNVHQIASRFRAHVRKALDDGDTST